MKIVGSDHPMLGVTIEISDLAWVAAAICCVSAELQPGHTLPKFPQYTLAFIC